MVSDAVQSSHRWRDTEEEKFSKGEERFGLLVNKKKRKKKVGHWSLWWVVLFWGRLGDDAHPARIGNRHPLVHPFRRRVRIGYTLQKSPSRETAGLTSVFDTYLDQACKYASAKST